MSLFIASVPSFDLVKADGIEFEMYEKIHLVPFAEYDLIPKLLHPLGKLNLNEALQLVSNQITAHQIIETLASLADLMD